MIQTSENEKGLDIKPNSPPDPWCTGVDLVDVARSVTSHIRMLTSPDCSPDNLQNIQLISSASCFTTHLYLRRCYIQLVDVICCYHAILVLKENVHIGLNGRYWPFSLNLNGSLADVSCYNYSDTTLPQISTCSYDTVFYKNRRNVGFQIYKLHLSLMDNQ